MHKKSRTTKIILISFLILSACGARTEEPTQRSGTAGQPVYLSVQPNHLQVNQMVEWHFTQVPEGVILTQYDFDPSPRSQQVVFTPPDTGVYKIMYTIKEMSGNPVLRKPFTLNVDRVEFSRLAADTAQSENSPDDAAAATSFARDDQIAQQQQDFIPDASSNNAPGENASTSGQDGALQKIPDRYTVQVAAWKSFSEAESMASRLKQQGYKAYIQRVQFPDTGEIWYRVRIGSYESAAAARTLKNKLENLSLLRNPNVWVDFQRKNR